MRGDILRGQCLGEDAGGGRHNLSGTISSRGRRDLFLQVMNDLLSLRETLFKKSDLGIRAFGVTWEETVAAC